MSMNLGLPLAMVSKSRTVTEVFLWVADGLLVVLYTLMWLSESRIKWFRTMLTMTYLCWLIMTPALASNCKQKRERYKQGWDRATWAAKNDSNKSEVSRPFHASEVLPATPCWSSFCEFIRYVSTMQAEFEVSTFQKSTHFLQSKKLFEIVICNYW